MFAFTCKAQLFTRDRGVWNSLRRLRGSFAMSSSLAVRLALFPFSELILTEGRTCLTLFSPICSSYWIDSNLRLLKIEILCCWAVGLLSWLSSSLLSELKSRAFRVAPCGDNLWVSAELAFVITLKILSISDSSSWTVFLRWASFLSLFYAMIAMTHFLSFRHFD